MAEQVTREWRGGTEMRCEEQKRKEGREKNKRKKI